MADEVNQEGQTPENNEPEAGSQVEQQPAQREYNDVEKRAMEQGWVPEDQYEGSGKWRTAEEFLERGEFFSKIDELNRRNKSIEAALHETKKHLAKVRDTEFKRALAQLRAEKKEAISQGDGDRVVEIDEQIAQTQEEARQEIAQLQAAPQQTQPNPVFMVWQSRNPWYQSDKAMTVYADNIGRELASNGLTDPKELLVEIERQVKKEFAHKFTNPNRQKPGAVEGGGSKGSGSRETFQLTPEETQVMRKLVKHGVMTEQEYIADIKASRKG